ncbi:kinase-like domain-containing protein [Gorgonomyces haynaldii]|nr:kinase-like domain-containing protein [Gorgonomyces haynaldii]
MFPEKSPPLNRRISIAERATQALENRIPFFKKDSQPQLYSQDQYSMQPEDYDIGKKIGHGSSAIVYMATYRPLGKPVAMKVIDLDMFERNQIDELRREIQIMSLSKHQNLLQVFGSFVKGQKLYIVTPFLHAGSCLDIMKTAFKEGMDENLIATILKQALQGLDYLHRNGLIHRDVKAGNLLVDGDGLVTLADFGVSSSLMEHGDRKTSRKTFVGTPCWMAPEVMEQSGYDYKADIWSFGITALELAYGHAPYAKFPPMKVLMMTLQNDPPTLDREKTKNKYSKTFKDMIDLCLNKDPNKRPTCEKLLQHSFFKSAKKPEYLVKNMLEGLPFITERQHREAPQENQDSVRTGEEWDFEDAGEKKEDSKVSFEMPSSESPVEMKPPSIPAKKSRFVVNGEKEPPNRENSTSSVNSNTVSSNEVRKGRFSVLEAPSGSQSTVMTPASGQPSAPGSVTSLQQVDKEIVRKNTGSSEYESNTESVTSHTCI